MTVKINCVIVKESGKQINAGEKQMIENIIKEMKTYAHNHASRYPYLDGDVDPLDNKTLKCLLVVLNKMNIDRNQLTSEDEEKIIKYFFKNPYDVSALIPDYSNDY